MQFNFNGALPKFAKYVKVEVYNEERENNPMLRFSSTDPNCIPNRRQMSKGRVNRMNSFLKKQFLYLFYLTVQCQITERCSYIIIISKKNEVVIEHMGVFNYYISEKNRNMNFKFKNDLSLYYI